MEDKRIFCYRISDFSSKLLEYLSDEMSQTKNAVLDSALIKYYEDLLDNNLIYKMDSDYTESYGTNNLSTITEDWHVVTFGSLYDLYMLISHYDYNYDIPNWDTLSKSDEYAVLQYLMEHNGYSDKDKRLPEFESVLELTQADIDSILESIYSK